MCRLLPRHQLHRRSVLRRCGVPFADAAQADRAGCALSCHDRPPLFGSARAALRYDDAARRADTAVQARRPHRACRRAGHMMVRAGATLLQRADCWCRCRYIGAALRLAATTRPRCWPADRLRGRRSAGYARCAAPDPRHGAAKRQIGRRSVPRSWTAPSPCGRARAPRLAGRRVLLIDDVMTSGATANACIAELLAAGAATVNVLAAARVPDPRLQ